MNPQILPLPFDPAQLGVLRDAGVSARYLVGGIEDWKKAGRPLQPK